MWEEVCLSETESTRIYRPRKSQNDDRYFKNDVTLHILIHTYHNDLLFFIILLKMPFNGFILDVLEAFQFSSTISECAYKIQFAFCGMVRIRLADLK